MDSPEMKRHTADWRKAKAVVEQFLADVRRVDKDPPLPPESLDARSTALLARLSHAGMLVETVTGVAPPAFEVGDRVAWVEENPENESLTRAWSGTVLGGTPDRVLTDVRAESFNTGCGKKVRRHEIVTVPTNVLTKVMVVWDDTRLPVEDD